jgi:hypothetical protein
MFASLFVASFYDNQCANSCVKKSNFSVNFDKKKETFFHRFFSRAKNSSHPSTRTRDKTAVFSTRTKNKVKNVFLFL